MEFSATIGVSDKVLLNCWVIFCSRYFFLSSLSICWLFIDLLGICFLIFCGMYLLLLETAPQFVWTKLNNVPHCFESKSLALLYKTSICQKSLELVRKAEMFSPLLIYRFIADRNHTVSLVCNINLLMIIDIFILIPCKSVYWCYHDAFTLSIMR